MPTYGRGDVIDLRWRRAVGHFLLCSEEVLPLSEGPEKGAAGGEERCPRLGISDRLRDPRKHLSKERGWYHFLLVVELCIHTTPFLSSLTFGRAPLAHPSLKVLTIHT
mmetsp:Transcript_2379/g.2553  ORF Transcript_2379/g.2553 Transcript_2379/m.2553 type:complete len:108 (-) Transcript_2379:165-488(-)